MSTHHKPDGTTGNFFVRLFPLIFCVSTLLIASCSSPFGDASGTGQRVKAPSNQQIFTIPEVGILDFDTLDPALAHDPASIQAVQMSATGLVQLDHNLHVQPQLALSWHQDSDGVTWTFKLKTNVKFSDGTPLTSSDVAYSLDRALQPATKSAVAPIYLKLIKDSDQLLAGRIQTLIGDSILTPDPHTIVLITSKRSASFLSMLTNTCAYVVEKSMVQKYGTNFTEHLDEGGSSGPFKVARFVHRSHIDFVPNTRYYSLQPQLQKVTLVIYPSDEETYQNYQSGKLDETAIPLTSLESERKQKEFHQIPQLWINYYAMNYLAKPFDNIHIRQAFALAIDKNTIARDVWKNTMIPTNHIVPQGMDGYNPQLTAPDGTTNLSGNPKKAQQLLQQGIQEEHWSSVAEMPAIHLTYVNGVSNFDQEVQALIQNWQRVLNVTVIADPVDYNTLLNKVTTATGNPDGIQMWGLAWVGEYPDLQDWLSMQFGRGSAYNTMNYGENSSMTAALQQQTQQQLAQADADMNASQRTQLYQQAEQQIVNDVGWIPMTQETETFLRNRNIVGIIDNAQNIIPPDDWANIYRIQ